MKHTPKVTIALVLFFFMAQFIGLLIINQYIDHRKTIEQQEVVLKPLPYGFERPEIKNKSISFVPILLYIFLGTIMLLFIIRMNKPVLLRGMFFISVAITLSVAFAAFMNTIIAGLLALTISFLRLYKPNVAIQNFSEVFIYGGLAAIMVNIFNIFAAFMFLIMISIYDYIAVYKTKHMVNIAKFQTNSRAFAGLLIPYDKEKISLKYEPLQELTVKRKKTRVAVLGGGDIGFTLIFAGVVMKELMLKETVLIGFLKTLIIPVFVSLALFALLLKGEQNKFYPAMPILSLGCFLGYLIIIFI
ncbi:MAG: presenilin family intramembrane aspartyl protease [Nanoarchaeota archaeon]